MEAIKLLLDIDSNDVRVIRIHGLGRIGKTAISKPVYYRIVDLLKKAVF